MQTVMSFELAAHLQIKASQQLLIKNNRTGLDPDM